MWSHFSEEELNILKERANRVRQTDEQILINRVSTLFIRIAGIQYALPIETLVAVYFDVPIVPVPCVPSYIRGVANLRGQIMPTIDLAHLFNIQDTDHNQEKYYCILASIEQQSCAFYVQTVNDIEFVDLDTLSSVAEQSYKREYLQGVSDENVILIDVQAILSDPSLVVNESVL